MSSHLLKDHLGNTRVVIANKNGDYELDLDMSNPTVHEIIQENHYYPFGMAHELGSNSPVADTEYRYLYNGKELDEELGLNWLDYGARWYDPSIGRWNALDPAAEDYLGWSPYNYTMNNPLKYIDPTGENAELIFGDGTITVRMDLYYYGNINDENFDATGWTKYIQGTWNTGAQGVNVMVDGKEYSVNFEITGQVIGTNEVLGKKQQMEKLKKYGDGTSWARANFIKIGNDIANQTPANDLSTINTTSDPTARPHEIGHLLGLKHQGGEGKGKNVPIEGPPGIMATVNNTVSGDYSIDGLPTKWGKVFGVYRTTQGELDRSQRRVLPHEVKRIFRNKNGNRIRGRRTNSNRAYILGQFPEK